MLPDESVESPRLLWISTPKRTRNAVQSNGELRSSGRIHRVIRCVSGRVAPQTATASRRSRLLIERVRDGFLAETVHLSDHGIVEPVQ